MTAVFGVIRDEFHFLDTLVCCAFYFIDMLVMLLLVFIDFVLDVHFEAFFNCEVGVHFHEDEELVVEGELIQFLRVVILALLRHELSY